MIISWVVIISCELIIEKEPREGKKEKQEQKFNIKKFFSIQTKKHDRDKWRVSTFEWEKNTYLEKHLSFSFL